MKPVFSVLNWERIEISIYFFFGIKMFIEHCLLGIQWGSLSARAFVGDVGGNNWDSILTSKNSLKVETRKQAQISQSSTA